MTLSEADKQRVKEAVAKAEQTTSGEIVPLVVQSSDAYPHAEFAGGIIGQALALIVAIWLAPIFDYATVIAVTVGGFFAGFFATRVVPAIKRAILGRKIVKTEVYQRALQAFFELGVGNTREGTGILIMVSMLERRVQVLADRGINAKVDPGTWDQVVDLVLADVRKGSLVGGLCAGIDRCGELLGASFPIAPNDINELDDELRVEK